MDGSVPVARQRFVDLNLLALPALRLGQHRAEVLGWGFIEPRWWRNYLHVHSFYEVCYAFQGRGTFQVQEQIYPVQRGDVFIAKPSLAHEIIADEHDPLGIYFWAYTLQSVDTDAGSQDVDHLLAAFPAVNHYVSGRVPAMQRTLELLTEEIVSRELGYVQAIEHLVSKLLLDTARSVVHLPSLLVEDRMPVKRPEEAVVQVIIRYIRDNYARPLSLRDIAAQVHLSERHTNRLFHQHMGVPIMEYLGNYRLEMAGHALFDKQKSIKQVAQECGYPDVRYFSTIFRRRMGMTPGEFRRRGGTRFLGGVVPPGHIQPE